jgi:hypothetical protein
MKTPKPAFFALDTCVAKEIHGRFSPQVESTAFACAAAFRRRRTDPN